MKYVVFRHGSRQYRVSEGDVIEVDRVTENPKEEVMFSDVLLYTLDGTPKLGTPTVSGITVSATVIEHTKGEKIRVAKFRAKSRYRRVLGFRASLTKVKIDAIMDGKAKDKPLKSINAAEKTQGKITEENETVKPKKIRKTATKKT